MEKGTKEVFMAATRYSGISRGRGLKARLSTREWKRLGHRGKGVAQPRPINYAAGGRLGRITLSRDAARQREARASCHPGPALRGGICINGGRIFLGRSEHPRREVKEYSFFTFFSLSRMLSKVTLLGLLVISRGMSCVGHDDHDKDQMPLDYVRYPYQATYYPGDDSGPCSSHHAQRSGFFDHDVPTLPVTADSIFSGISTFAKLPWVQCLTKDKNVPFDIAFLGAPFVSP